VSYYDFPDIAQCLLKDCGDPRDAQVQPFVSFFSGHVATLVINANHMYVHGYKGLGIFFHLFDVFQIIRLLATRGHYSIDIVIGWYMAVYVSNPAGRLGRHFSRGDKSLSELFVPVSAEGAFERFCGVTFVREDRRMSKFIMNNPQFKQSFEKAFEEDAEEEFEPDGSIPEPAARIAYEEFAAKVSSESGDSSGSGFWSHHSSGSTHKNNKKKDN
jgi:hypothetical protein